MIKTMIFFASFRKISKQTFLFNTISFQFLNDLESANNPCQELKRNPLIFFSLQVGSSVSNTHLLSGRIINLGIYCRNESTTQTRRGCLLFKLGGNITCESYGSLHVSCIQNEDRLFQKE